MALKILVLGNGGREHALAWKLSQSDLVQHIFVAPGNGGTSQLPKTSNVQMSISDFNPLVKFALDEEVRCLFTTQILLLKTQQDQSRRSRS